MTAWTARVTPDAVGYEHSRTLRRRGALILALFAVLWTVVAASGVPQNLASGMRIAGIVVGTAIALSAFRPGNGLPERRRQQPEGWYRNVGLVNLVQAGAIALAVLGFVAAGTPEMVPPVVCLIVGLHFFPLARLFDQPEYWWAAAGCSAAGIVGLVVLTAATPEASRVVVGLGAAATLWVTAARLSLRA